MWSVGLPGLSLFLPGRLSLGLSGCLLVCQRVSPILGLGVSLCLSPRLSRPLSPSLALSAAALLPLRFAASPAAASPVAALLLLVVTWSSCLVVWAS